MHGVLDVAEPRTILIYTHDCIIIYPILKQGRFHNVRCCPTTTMSWNPCMTTPANSRFAAGNGSNQPIPSKIADDTYHQPWIQGAENWELASCNLHRCFRTTRSAQPGASPKETRQHRYEDVSWLLMIGRQECCCHFEVGITRGDWVLLCWNPNGSNINLQNVFGNESFHSFKCCSCMSLVQSYAFSLRHTHCFFWGRQFTRDHRFQDTILRVANALAMVHVCLAHAHFEGTFAWVYSWPPSFKTLVKSIV